MVMGEIATCVKYRLPIKLFVQKNNLLGMIRWEQMMFLGNPEYGVELQDIDFAKVAEALKRGQPNRERIGLTLFRDAVEDFGENRELIEEGLRKQAPDVLESAERSEALAGSEEKEPQASLDSQREAAPERAQD